jgi:hypothetical protein
VNQIEPASPVDALSTETKLNPAERRELMEAESQIAAGLDTFYDVAGALYTVRNKKLWREQYVSFEAYCRERWDIGKRYANRLIEAGEVLSNLGPIDPKPENEAQARELSRNSKELQSVVMQIAVKTAPLGADNKPLLTAGHIRAVGDTLTALMLEGNLDDGSGNPKPIGTLIDAAITEEVYERLMRQKTYIREKTEGKRKEASHEETAEEAKARHITEAGGHHWRKTSLVTESGGFDKQKCELCDATGKRFGISWPPVADKKTMVICPKAESATQSTSTASSEQTAASTSTGGGQPGASGKAAQPDTSQPATAPEKSHDQRQVENCLRRLLLGIDVAMKDRATKLHPAMHEPYHCGKDLLGEETGEDLRVYPLILNIGKALDLGSCDCCERAGLPDRRDVTVTCAFAGRENMKVMRFAICERDLTGIVFFLNVIECQVVDSRETESKATKA